MLRDFTRQSDIDDIRKHVERFDIKSPQNISVVKFEVISYDSFMWVLVLDNELYYMYAEDYVSGLDSIKSMFSKYMNHDNWELIEARVARNFTESTPVQSANVYKVPDDAVEIMKYAVESGHDFVFLAKSRKDTIDALC